MNIIRLPIWILLAALLGGCGGCQTKTPDPLAGWKVLFSRDYEKFDKAITDDYQDYIQKLPPKERNGVGPISYFEDGTGQHAVRIEIAINGTDWAHVLIYDKNNKRIKVIKFVSGHYRS